MHDDPSLEDEVEDLAGELLPVHDPETGECLGITTRRLIAFGQRPRARGVGADDESAC